MLARARGENFPVAPWLLPRAQRWHLLAIYGFARLADHLGDEAAGDRRELLDQLERELDLVFRSEPRHPILQRLAPTVRSLQLPDAPFRRLIEANRRDQRVHRYQTHEQLLRYCALSANPIGELVLHVFGVATPRRIELSDAVCTALQLTEHWQDLAEDRDRGRVYLPAEDLVRFHCTGDDLRAPVASPALRELMRFEVERTHALFHEGAALLGTLRGRARLAIAAFVAGGQAALDAIAHREFDVLGGPPRPRRRDFLRRFAALALGASPARSAAPARARGRR